MNEILYLIFVFPGYLIFIILRFLLKGFGKKADVLDKIIYSMVLNIPIFIITILIIDNYLLSHKDISSVNQILAIVSMDIDLIIYIILIVLISSIIVGISAHILIIIVGIVGNKLRGYNIDNFSTAYRECIVKPSHSIPMIIYDMKKDKIIDQGFMQKASTDEEDIHEFVLIEHDLFEKARNIGLIKNVEYTYINIDKGYKIIAYNQKEIERIYNSKKGGGSSGQQK